MDYLKVFKESLSIWWKNKFLWILGFIAVIFGGSVGGNSSSFSSNQNFGSSSGSNSGVNSIMDSNAFNSLVSSLYKFITSPLGIIIVVIVLFLIILIALISLYLKSRADSSLISATSLLVQNKVVTFKQAWGLSKKNWSKLFWLNILINIPLIFLNLIIVVLVIIGVFLFLRGMATYPSGVINSDTQISYGIGLLIVSFGFLVCCLTIVYGTVAKIIVSFANRIAVLQDKKVVESIKLSWNFIKVHFTDLLVFWLITLAWGFVLFVVSTILVLLIIPIGLVIIPILLINWILGVFLIILVIVGFGILSLAISGPIYSFSEVYWTRVYLELTKSNA